MFGLAALGGIVASGVLLARRGSLLARLAGAEQAARGAESNEARAESARAALQARVDDLTTRNASLERLLAVEQEGRQADADRAASELRAADDRMRDRFEEFERQRAMLLKQVADLQAQMKDTFASLAGQALTESSQRFLDLAKEHLGARIAEADTALEQRRKSVEDMLRPVSETLGQTRDLLAQFKEQRAAADASLKSSIDSVLSLNELLRTNTNDLVNLLQKPKALGDWGELQLRRVAELAGMKDFCDFDEQVAEQTLDGERYRPDMVVRLPDGLVLAVDAKASLAAFANAARARTDDEREARLAEHAGNVLARVKELGRKSYWSLFPGSPQITVLFLPGDQVLDRALSQNHALIEEAARNRVVIATPASLIALIRVAALAWQQKDLSDQFEQLRTLGVEMHSRIVTVLGHAARLGSSLRAAAEHYNSLVGSAERNLLSTARKFEDVDMVGPKRLDDIDRPEPIATELREPRALPPSAQTGL